MSLTTRTTHMDCAMSVMDGTESSCQPLMLHAKRFC